MLCCATLSCLVQQLCVHSFGAENSYMHLESRFFSFPRPPLIIVLLIITEVSLCVVKALTVIMAWMVVISHYSWRTIQQSRILLICHALYLIDECGIVPVSSAFNSCVTGCNSPQYKCLDYTEHKLSLYITSTLSFFIFCFPLTNVATEASI